MSLPAAGETPKYHCTKLGRALSVISQSWGAPRHHHRELETPGVTAWILETPKYHCLKPGRPLSVTTPSQGTPKHHHPKPGDPQVSLPGARGDPTAPAPHSSWGGMLTRARGVLGLEEADDALPMEAPGAQQHGLGAGVPPAHHREAALPVAARDALDRVVLDALRHDQQPGVAVGTDHQAR